MKGQRPRPTFEDYFRALAYLGFFLWAVAFLVFPPVAYQGVIDVSSRLLWLGACGVGAATACVGAATRLDLKVELPGLIFMGVGPLIYFSAQIYYLIHPPVGTDPNARVALSVYAILPLLLCLPRIYALYSEARRQKRIHGGTKRKA